MLNELNMKDTITMHKPWPQTGSFGLHLHEIITKLKSVVEIPTGYQDETGFHFGAEPAEKEIKWPTAW
jgi:hypothetical protein